MNRQIIFRGKDVNGVWHHGYLFQGQTEKNEKYSVILKQVRYEVDDRLPEDTPFAFYKNEVSVVVPNTVGQFTGFCDKNKKDIYEGDILKYVSNDREEKEIYETLYINGIFYAKSNFNNHKYPLRTFLTCSLEAMCTVTIIGNIYDNKDLLNKE